MTDIFTKQKRSKVMSLIKQKRTTIEEKFRKAMCANNIKGYRINPKVYGKPDFIFSRKKIALYCDGDFWHGREYKKLKLKLKNKFWKNKIENNIKRDRKYNRELKKKGWTVVRFWGSDINKDVNKCIMKLMKYLEI